MKRIIFTITEDEIREIANNEDRKRLSDKQVRSVLDMVECDEMLWKDIHNSIIGAVRELAVKKSLSHTM
jgi:hypothetical protein